MEKDVLTSGPGSERAISYEGLSWVGQGLDTLPYAPALILGVSIHIP